MPENKIQDFLKPRKGKIRQGYYTCRHPEKYVGDLANIVFRSSWEFKFLKWCDNSPSVLKFASEPIAIPYMCSVDHKVHNYYIDFWAEMIDRDGKVSRWLIEIKPERHLIIPPEPKNPTAKAMMNHIDHVKRVMKNLSKFRAARNFAKIQNMKFAVLRLDRTSGEFEFLLWEKGAENGF